MSRQAEVAGAGEAPQSVVTGGGRMAGEERRRQIVEVAMRLFSERGFRGATTKEIAQAAGVSEAIIFRHFATKEELYTAIIDRKACVGEHASASVFDSIKCSVGEAMRRKDDRAVFEGVALAMMRHHEDDPQFLRLLLYSALEGHQLAQIFWDRNVRVMYEFLGSYVTERQRDGAFRAVDSFVAVRAFSGAIIHHSLNNILWDKDPARRILNLANEEAARAFTDVLMKGICVARTVRTGRQQARRRSASHKGARVEKKAPEKK